MPTREIPLVPFREFAKRVPRILAVTKAESDKQLHEMQAANARRRAAKKKAA
jgi:hypothetical protein